MPKYVYTLLKIIAIQQKLIIALMIFALGKKFEFLNSKSDDKPIDKKYHRLIVDKMPIFKKIVKFDYKILLEQYQLKHNKPLKPIKRRKESSVPKSLICPICGAPHIYIYDNNGHKGQFKCKICNTNFHEKNHFAKFVVFKCPHCGKTLEKIKERKDFFVHKCTNKKCSFYLKNLQKMDADERKIYKNDPSKFKLHYIYREFTFDFNSLDKDSLVPIPSDLSKIQVSPYTLGLILSYNINFGISARKTANLLKEIHGINISYQSILNYAKAVATNVKPIIDNYPYKLSDSICGDETYTKVLGKWKYIFFFFDTKKKIILSHYTSSSRDTKSACKALIDVISKYRELPEDFQVIVDGNPIYLLAQQFFAQHDINFNVEQVIGLTNKDKVSKKFRPLKQIIERLNRTFKENYHYTNGYNSHSGAFTSVTLFTAYFNFLRPHSSLENNVPVVIPELTDLPNMPARWGKLIELSQYFIPEKHIA
ncbi:DDE-type integrase/transposase/recombinase [Haliovirga abyssi]|uniref:Integrase catalytic domain-containing protein n=1 Tax=Haliovirga abyssi TaxID=2996794 RepID=A0AAU9D5D7_9FUSO|nr:DDE-type integrase/transposase/recombinase [Haliovirga abyssi]BDU50404.1 hypothetical protein HLVA_09730 [Haliovirga abyssi]BDU51184.1 hypothetical protein HLVA_17530 [Haliovirga abyssi]BDU51209.1 hypothetical protein HLVA_17780 [Haliovirga abyssi]